MKKTFPIYHTLKYKFEEGYYSCYDRPIEFYKLPQLLKIESTRRQDIINSNLIARSKEKTEAGKFKFFTGILPTEKENLFFGDHYEIIRGEKKNSFILFEFSQDKTLLDVFFFNGYKLYPKQRKVFIGEFNNVKRGRNN